MDRHDQHCVLVWALDGLDGRVEPLPDLPTDRLHRALLSTGLGPLAARLTSDHGVVVDPESAAHLGEQARAVATRHRRYLTLAPDLLAALDRAGCRATPVKGIVLTSVGVWPWPTARPMADIDLLVPEEQRGRASDVVVAAGLVHAEHSPTEDVYLAWGDGLAGRTDGESATHNGKVEIHPGWSERLHGYNAVFHDLLGHTERRTFLGTNAWMLPPEWLVTHVIGHLSACVIRRDVRPLNVVDVVLALRWLDPFGQAALREAVGRLDRRLSIPALWLAGHYAPGEVEAAGLTPDLSLLSTEAHAWLDRTEPFDVFRDASARSPWAWRASFTHSPGERVAVMREAALPPTAQLRRSDPDASIAALYGRRVARALGRFSHGSSAR